MTSFSSLFRLSFTETKNFPFPPILPDLKNGLRIFDAASVAVAFIDVSLSPLLFAGRIK